jgi:two-component system phosphate regulon sensor histidine kinase PhoR
MPMVRVMAAVAGVPLAALAVLVVLGQALPVPALVAGLAVVAASLGWAALWTGDVQALALMLRRVGSPPADIRELGAWPRAGRNMGFFAPLAAEVALVAQVLGEREAELDRLRRAEESILEHLPDPLIVLGPDRAVRRTNEAARIAFGRDIAAVLRHPDLRAAIDRALAAGADKPPQVAEVSVPVPVPREVHVTVAGLASPLAGGAGALVVLSDRSRERAVERTRADFVANASHELRTPLASLMGFIDTLRGPAADDLPAQARFLDIMAEQAARMNRLIDDLLSLSRIELTEHQVPADSVDISDLLDRVLAAFEIRIRQRGVTLNFVADEALPPVAGDADQLEQVFQNLIDNALKYGRQGGVLRVRLTTAAPGGKWPARAGLVVEVADDGQGIAREHLPRLTERFYRVDNGRSRAIGGTGLGLAIVKHVVNRHRGQLFIESVAGNGSVFSVWLPSAA